MEERTLQEDELLLALIERARQSEGIVVVDGTIDGERFVVYVATGANAGLMQQQAQAGTLCLEAQQ